ncbi:MAG TPA: PqiC family protein [Acetobacteraceae bacterium]|nr:PqiC family protein [Acetobacteraceae bacterium]
MKRLVLATALVLAGCGSSPATHFYTLVPQPPAHADPVVSPKLPLQLGRITLPVTLDRLGLVTFGPGTAVSVSDQDRWAAPLKDLVRSVLTSDLRQRLGASRVLDPGVAVPGGRVLIVALDVQRFAADHSGEVVLAADWTLVRAAGNSQQVLGVHRVTLRAPAGSTRGNAVSAAMSNLLGELADRIANAG